MLNLRATYSMDTRQHRLATLGPEWSSTQEGPSANEFGHWNTDVTWNRLRRDVEGFPDGLKLLELCGGTGTAHIALQELLKDIATFIVVDH